MTEACCQFSVDGSWSCEDLDPCDCFNLPQGEPKGPGTTCALMCPDHLDVQCERCGTQACCIPGGGDDFLCADLNRGDCDFQSGTQAGPGSICREFPDRPVIGDGDFLCEPLFTCCFPDGSCARSDTPCGSLGGLQIQGQFVSCTGVDCFAELEITEACCSMSGSCSDVPFRDCCDDGGRPQGAGTDCATLGGSCAPFVPIDCRTVRPDERATHPVTGVRYRATTADLCALAFLIPWTLLLTRGSRMVTVRPVRTHALSSRRTDEGVEPCHLQVTDLVDDGRRWAANICGQRISGNSRSEYQSHAGVVLIQNDDLKGHFFVGAYETPPWQEIQFHSKLTYCPGVKR